MEKVLYLTKHGDDIPDDIARELRSEIWENHPVKYMTGIILNSPYVIKGFSGDPSGIVVNDDGRIMVCVSPYASGLFITYLHRADKNDTGEISTFDHARNYMKLPYWRKAWVEVQFEGQPGSRKATKIINWQGEDIGKIRLDEWA